MMSTTRVTTILLALACLCVVSFLSATPAGATLGGFTLAGEMAIEGGGGGAYEGLAVDETAGYIYVYDSEDTIYKYDLNGNPVDFSALGTNKIVGVGRYGAGETELAVDNSSGPTKGDIYLAAPNASTGGGEIKIYGPDGKSVGRLIEVGGRPWGEVCGVAVDGAGNVYVALYPETIDRYTPTGSTVTNDDYSGSHGGFSEICHIAADGEGRIYARTWEGSRLVRLDSFQAAGIEFVSNDAISALAAANGSSGELFSGQQGGVVGQYNSAGDPLSTFGDGVLYIGLAFDAKNGQLYASGQGKAGKIEVWQGFVTPAVRTLEPSGETAAGNATLNGSVDPEGETIESCSFQYGSSEAYGSEAACAQSLPLTGTSALPVSADLTGLTLNHTYHYRLSASDPHGTINGGDRMFTILVAPTVEEPTVSEITRSTAVLSGAVNPREGETGFHFEYGPTEAYGNTTPTVHSGDLVSSEVPITQEVVGLIPDIVYHYRLVATNVAGTTYGPDHTFTSGERALPGAVTGGAVDVAQNTATITGTVDTNGLPTSYGFEIATSADYGPPTGLGYIGAGEDEALATLPLTGLQPGTTYHYRITASNVDGTRYGIDHTFTTGVYVSTFAEPPAPLPFVTVPAVTFPAETKVSATKKKPVKKTKKKRTKSRKHPHKKKRK